MQSQGDISVASQATGPAAITAAVATTTVSSSHLVCPTAGFRPDWSPDGTRIAFVSIRDGDREIYVMAPNGSNLVQLTNNDNGEADPTWSPDGSRIAFASDQDGDYEIYVMAADGTGLVRQLTHNTADDRAPV
jgi:Tol biopolymer transport system component